MLTSGVKYSKIKEAFKDQVHITNYVLKKHFHEHIDKALRIDLIQSIQSGKIKVHNTAKKLFELIEESDEIYSIGKDILVQNITDPAVVTKTINSLTRLMATQRDMLKFNASLLQQTDEKLEGGVDLITMARKLERLKPELVKK